MTLVTTTVSAALHMRRRSLNLKAVMRTFAKLRARLGIAGTVSCASADRSRALVEAALEIWDRPNQGYIGASGPVLQELLKTKALRDQAARRLVTARSRSSVSLSQNESTNRDPNLTLSHP